jgi:hypothetical protein
MANRLEPINVTDFRGGLNLRKDQLQIAENESPEMANIALDPEGGIRTRDGWQRWNVDDIVDLTTETWDPQRAWLHQLSDGTDVVYIANDATILHADGTNVFTDLVCPVAATPHLADFATWGNDFYIAAGRTLVSKRRSGLGAVASLTAAGVGTWNDNYLTPLHGVMPKTELVEAHAGYLFVANTNEDGVNFPNRVRWSHPTSPDDWATDDFLDINTGGAEITALMSFEDHLLIFKPDSVWALYGYDEESWQLVQKSSTAGALSPQAVTRSEMAVFWYSPSERGALFSYNGERPMEISQAIRPAIREITNTDLVWVGWISRKLWVSLPWTYLGATADSSSVFVWDPSLSEIGSWMYFTAISGALGPIVGGSNVDSLARPMGVMRNTETPCVVQLEAIDDFAADMIWDVAVLGGFELEDIYIVTDADEEIVLSGVDAIEAFDTVYRTSWIHADWPTRKKSWRRPDFVCLATGAPHSLRIESFRDYNHQEAKRSSTLEVSSVGAHGVWGSFDWGDGTEWGEASGSEGAVIRRGSSFGLAKAIQIRITGLTAAARWGIDAIVAKIVMRRFR